MGQSFQQMGCRCGSSTYDRKCERQEGSSHQILHDPVHDPGKAIEIRPWELAMVNSVIEVQRHEEYASSILRM